MLIQLTIGGNCEESTELLVDKANQLMSETTDLSTTSKTPKVDVAERRAAERSRRARCRAYGGNGKRNQPLAGCAWAPSRET